MSSPPWFAGGLRFECRRCGRCCTGEPGYVFFRLEEAEAIGAFLGLELEGFLARHSRGVPGGLSLLELDDGRCEFFSAGCRIYPVRPRQCRTYPFWPRVVASRAAWAREGRECPGIGGGELRAAGEILSALGPAQRLRP